MLEKLHELYFDDKKNLTKIAEIVDASVSFILKALR